MKQNLDFQGTLFCVQEKPFNADFLLYFGVRKVDFGKIHLKVRVL